MQTIVIIGNGISGVTVARHIRKRSSKDRIIIISKETKYMFSRTALMYIYMGHMKFENTQPYEPYFWEKNRIELKQCLVTSVNFNEKKLIIDGGEQLAYDQLILACGSKPNKFGWPGQDLKGVHGMYSYQNLKALEDNSENIKEAVIVGGGLIGIELAEMLISRGKKVTFLVRENSFWNNVLPAEESKLVTDHILSHKQLDLRLGEELKEIVSDDRGYCKEVKISTGEILPAQFVGLTAGVSPNISFLKELETLEINRGILVNEFFETSQKDVYAIGDCAEHRNPPPGRRPVEQVWYTGRLQGEQLAANLYGDKKAYDPGPWFNSAKFMDLEYQTYGMVMPKLSEGQTQFCWKHPTEERLLKLVFEEESGEFIGLNVFGMRLRHEYFDSLLRKKASIQEVLSGFTEANFDPEFFKQNEPEIISAFNKAFPQFKVVVPSVSFFGRIFA